MKVLLIKQRATCNNLHTKFKEKKYIAANFDYIGDFISIKIEKIIIFFFIRKIN